MNELRLGELARTRRELEFFDIRPGRVGLHNLFPEGTMVRITLLGDVPEDHSYPALFCRFHVTTLSNNFQARVSERDLKPMSPLEQLAEQADG
jgi:hypothetical protein